MPQKPLIIAILLAVSGLYSFAISGVKLSYLDALFLDFRNYLTATDFDQSEIVSVSLSSLKKSKDAVPSSDFLRALEFVDEAQPKLMVLALNRGEIQDIESLRIPLEKFGNLYLYSKWGSDRSFYESEKFKDFPRNIILKATEDTKLEPFDFKTRRFVLSMYGKEIDEDLEKFISVMDLPQVQWVSLAGTFSLYDSKQFFIRYYKQSSLQDLPIESIKPGDLKGKIVVITTNDNFAGAMLHPYARFKFEENKEATGLSSVGSYILNIYGNLKNLDYIRQPAPYANMFWILGNIFLNLLFLFFLRDKPKKYILWSFLLLPVQFAIGLMLFKVTLYNVDFSRVLIGHGIIQYLGIPFLSVRYLRKIEKEKYEIQKHAEKEKDRMKFSVKIAEAEMSMKIAAKVSHDLRSPIMALQIASGYLKGKVDEDVNSLIVESANRVRHIADDTLMEYKGKRKRIVAQVDCGEVLGELVKSYRHLYPKLYFTLLGDEFIGVQVPFYSLQRVASNILNNAIEAGAQNIEILLSSTHSHVRFSITNDGPIIPAEVRGKLFQEKASFGKKDGTGLGLYQVRTEIQLYGGSVTLADSRATSFVIEIPKESNVLSFSLEDNVIVVESKADIYNEIKDNGSYRVTLADSFENFLKQIDTEEDQTILLDIAFESLDGTAFDVLDKVKTLPRIHLILFSTMVENIEIQKIASSYDVLLVEKWRLAAGVCDHGKNVENVR